MYFISRAYRKKWCRQVEQYGEGSFEYGNKMGSDLGEFCRRVLPRVQKIRQVFNNLNIAFGRGRLHMDFDIGEELGGM